MVLFQQFVEEYKQAQELQQQPTTQRVKNIDKLPQAVREWMRLLARWFPSLASHASLKLLVHPRTSTYTLQMNLDHLQHLLILVFGRCLEECKTKHPEWFLLSLLDEPEYSRLAHKLQHNVRYWLCTHPVLSYFFTSTPPSFRLYTTLEMSNVRPTYRDTPIEMWLVPQVVWKVWWTFDADVAAKLVSLFRLYP